MSKFRKLMAIAALLFASSSVFVACSDDDGSIMGPISINSVQTTTSSVTLYWTIVPNSSCDGYNVQICEGTRANKGTVVINEDFDNRTAKATFNNLQPSTSYVAITKGIPSKGSGFDDAYTFEFEFVTAPLIRNIAVGAITYTAVTEEDKDGNEVVKHYGTVSATWTALQDNAASYTVSLFRWALADESKEESDKNKYGWQVVKTSTITDISVGKCTFANEVLPENKYRIGVRPNPGKGDWYPAGEMQYSADFTSPSAE